MLWRKAKKRQDVRWCWTVKQARRVYVLHSAGLLTTALSARELSALLLSPARHQQLGPAIGLHPLQMPNVLSRRIPPEGVLLRVGAAEHAVAEYIQERHGK